MEEMPVRKAPPAAPGARSLLPGLLPLRPELASPRLPALGFFRVSRLAPVLCGAFSSGNALFRVSEHQFQPGLPEPSMSSNPSPLHHSPYSLPPVHFYPLPIRFFFDTEDRMPHPRLNRGGLTCPACPGSLFRARSLCGKPPSVTSTLAQPPCLHSACPPQYSWGTRQGEGVWDKSLRHHSPFIHSPLTKPYP
jgi:hypothetical protein